MVSGNYFDALGIQPYLGRFIHASDEHGKNSVPYIVLSYAYWHSHFDSDRGVIGRTVQINKHPYTIVGVAPRDFRGTELFFAPDIWASIVDLPQLAGWDPMEERGDPTFVGGLAGPGFRRGAARDGRGGRRIVHRIGGAGDFARGSRDLFWRIRAASRVGVSPAAAGFHAAEIGDFL